MVCARRPLSWGRFLGESGKVGGPRAHTAPGAPRSFNIRWAQSRESGFQRLAVHAPLGPPRSLVFPHIPSSSVLQDGLGKKREIGCTQVLVLMQGGFQGLGSSVLWNSTGRALRTIRKNSKPGIKMHSCNPSRWEAEGGELLPLRDQPGLHGSGPTWTMRARLCLKQKKKTTKG